MLIHLHRKTIADLLAQNLLTERRFAADQTLAGITADRGDYANLFGVVFFGQIDGDFIEESDGIGRGVAVDDDGGLDHPLQIADAAAVLVLGLLGGFILKVLAQITEGAGALDLFNQSGHQFQPAVIELFLHLPYVFTGQFVVHKETSCQLRAVLYAEAKEKSSISDEDVRSTNFGKSLPVPGSRKCAEKNRKKLVKPAGLRYTMFSQV